MKNPNSIIYLVLRHGHSVADLEKRFEGRADFPLNDKGLGQARLAADWIAAHCRPDRIISSPLIRARVTAEEVARRVGIPVEEDDGLLERDNGVLAGTLKSEYSATGLAPLDTMLPHETVPGGETLIELRARAETFWSRLLSQSRVGQWILIVSHGQMINMLFQCFLRLPLDETVYLATGDTGIHCWEVWARRRKVVFANSQVHLGPGKEES